MTVLEWDKTGERYFETGVDRGVLYPPNNGVYDNGVAWNGLTTVTESPSGAESNPQYADNIKYLNLISAEEFGATIEAFTYPPEFAQFDGAVTLNGGVILGQQNRRPFGLSYRTKLGNDQLGSDYGYKLHMVYGCQAAPSERAYATVNDSPEAMTLSWELSTTPVPVTGQKPTAILTVDSTKVTSAGLTALQNALWGTAGTNPRLPLPDEVIGMFAGTLTSVQPLTTPPTYTSGTRTITLPATTGIVWRVNGVVRTGSFVLNVGDYGVVRAAPATGYVFPAITQDTWVFGPAV
jgi:hypothetical protein